MTFSSNPRTTLHLASKSQLAGGSEACRLAQQRMNDLLCTGSLEASAIANGSLSAHLDACPACAQELATLRDSLTLFRDAGIQYADRQLSQIERVSPLAFRSRGSLPQSALWLTAAAAMLAVAIVPIQRHRQHALQAAPAAMSASSAPTVASDEALLEDIDRQLSASVPGPMQSLADPTASLSLPGTANTTSPAAQRNN